MNVIGGGEPGPVGTWSARAGGVLFLALTAACATSTVPEPADVAVAVGRDVVVTESELLDWLTVKGVDAEPCAEAAIGALENLVVLKALAARTAELGLGEGLAVRHRLARAELARQRLEGHLRDRARPTEDEILRAFEDDPSSHGKPRRWQLRNIFKRRPEGATAEMEAALRAELEAIRRAVLEGADFGELAERHSDSANRTRAGRAGVVTLDVLGEEFAAAAERLTAGQVSPVVESALGYTLLYCDRVFDPVEPSLEEARPGLRRRLAGERYDRLWAELSDRLRTGAGQSLEPAAPDRAPEAVLATFRRGDRRETITGAELAGFAEWKRVDGELRDADAETLAALIDELVLLVLVADEADRLGLLEGSGFERELEWRRLELDARAVLAAEVEARVDEPDEATLRQVYERRREDFRIEPRWQITTLEVAITADRTMAYYERVRVVGERLARGDGTLAEALTELQPGAELVDHGWLSDGHAWALGRNVYQALTRLEPGQMSGAVQEGRKLLIVELRGREDERVLSFAEARPRIRELLVERSRRREWDRARDAILAAQEVRFPTCPDR